MKKKATKKTKTSKAPEGTFLFGKDAHTGKPVYIPNSAFFAEPRKNLWLRFLDWAFGV